MREGRRARADALATPLGHTMHVRLRLVDGDIREAIVNRMAEVPYEGFGPAVRWLLRVAIQQQQKTPVEENV